MRWGGSIQERESVKLFILRRCHRSEGLFKLRVRTSYQKETSTCHGVNQTINKGLEDFLVN